MANRYEGREVGQVEIYGLGPAILPDRDGGAGTEGIAGTVVLRLSAADGSFGGPSVTVELAIDHSPDSSVRDAQQQILAAAHELLGRMSSEPLEALRAKCSEGLAQSLLPPNS